VGLRILRVAIRITEGLRSAGEDVSMVTIRHERHADAAAREALLDLAFGDGRFDKSSERLRAGRLPAAGLSFVACENGGVVGTVRLWHVSAGGRPALLLGPLAVHPRCRSRGVGAALMRRALAEARRRGHAGIVLVGDAPYYARFGFSVADTGALTMAGRYEQHRLLGLELRKGALAGAGGMIVATGTKAPRRVHVPALPATLSPAVLSQAA
jgi:predicted N-acetyltransferase YhbS